MLHPEEHSRVRESRAGGGWGVVQGGGAVKGGEAGEPKEQEHSRSMVAPPLPTQPPSYTRPAPFRDAVAMAGQAVALSQWHQVGGGRRGEGVGGGRLWRSHNDTRGGGRRGEGGPSARLPAYLPTCLPATAYPPPLCSLQAHRFCNRCGCLLLPATA